ncbi:uncharacterized protein LOC141734776 [Larus michahellis]|uniref:uncharacterized protein LOC141734776 n=1 Tax=Larus michahellis TaxID=119627 RepID=UPI003D9AFEB6
MGRDVGPGHLGPLILWVLDAGIPVLWGRLWVLDTGVLSMGRDVGPGHLGPLILWVPDAGIPVLWVLDAGIPVPWGRPWVASPPPGSCPTHFPPPRPGPALPPLRRLRLPPPALPLPRRRLSPHHPHGQRRGARAAAGGGGVRRPRPRPDPDPPLPRAEPDPAREPLPRGGQQQEGCDPPGPSPAPQGPALLCPTCDDSDGSCRGPPAALPCPRPTDRCLWLSTRPPGQARAQELRGCGRVGACRALLGLESGNGTRGRHVTVRCCGGGSCPREPDPPPSGLRCWGCDGPEPHGCDPQVLLCRGGLPTVGARRPSGEPWLVRGCASPDWDRGVSGRCGAGAVGQGGVVAVGGSRHGAGGGGLRVSPVPSVRPTRPVPPRCVGAGGAVGLECLSCGAEDGTCRQAQNVTCPPESDVCAEALAALTWSHGRLALGARGCGRGRGGANARALPLSGLVLFARRRQCRGGRGCNGLLPLGTDGALPLPDDISEQPANGLRCFGCPEAGPCSPLRVLGCYGDQRGCFHGNLSLALGGVTLWREVRGCSRDAECGPTRVGDDAVGLTGSCCAGDLCNGPLPPLPPTNRSFFAPDRPRLQLLPHAHAPTPAPNLTKMAAAAAAPPPTNLPGGRQAAPRPAGAVTAMAATTTEMAAAGTKMAATRADVAAAGTRGVNGVKGGVDGVKGGVDGGVDLANGNMADPNMAAVDPNMATIDPKMATIDPNMATIDPKMATIDPKMATIDPNMAAADPKMATIDPKMAAVDPKMAAADPKMAAGAKAPSGRAGGGRPLGGAVEGGPKGRGHPIGCPGWLLPLLLWPLL